MRRIKNFIFCGSIWICVLLLIIVIIFSVFYNAGYDYGDFPYFSNNNILEHFIYVGIAVVLLSVFMIFGKIIRWNTITALICFLTISLVYLYTIQLKPFSDMGIVWQIATNGLKDESGYLSQYYNQIPLVVYLWILSNVFGNDIMVPKLANVILSMITCIFVGKIWTLLPSDNGKDESKIIWFAIPFIPVIIYENHIYNDILFTTLTVILLYFVLLASKNKGQKKLFIIPIILFSVLQYLFRPVGIIYIIAIAIYMLIFRKMLVRTLIYCIITALMIIGVTTANKTVFNIKEDRTIGIWSYIQMGINEAEFGFQDGTHSPNWTAEDCIQKYQNLGMRKILKIYGKKIIWTWSEGTYQAERYGFGAADAEYLIKNEITDKLKDVNGSKLRRAINKTMKGQYYLYILLGYIGIILVQCKTLGGDAIAEQK